jgi:hypothetical protein
VTFVDTTPPVDADYLIAVTAAERWPDADLSQDESCPTGTAPNRPGSDEGLY